MAGTILLLLLNRVLSITSNPTKLELLCYIIFKDFQEGEKDFRIMIVFLHRIKE